MRLRVSLLLFAVALVSIAAAAQQSPAASDPAQDSGTYSTQTNQPIQTEPMAQTPVYRVNVVERTARAVDYRGHSSSKVGMQGTSLDPEITGDTKVESHTGRFALDVKLHHLKPARDFGPMYLTYVLWVITPEGRAVNLGELVPDDDHEAKLQVTTALQAFGLIVTAEPYFAVTRPSDMVVAENIIPSDVKGWPRQIDAKFEALQRGDYSVNLNPAELPATHADKHLPLSLLEARNAVAIAEAAGADHYAADTMRKAKDDLERAEDYYRRKQSSGAIVTVAHSAAQSAEDARLLTMNRKQQEEEAEARQQLQNRIASAKSEAEAARERAELARMQTQQEAQQRAQAEEERRAAQREARLARQERASAQQELQQAEQARQDAEQQKQQLAEQAQNAQQQAQNAQQQAQQAQQQAEQQRAKLLLQLKQVLQTRETARGLVSRMPDVLFATNQATLRPDAKIKLAKVAGIIMAYPDLKLEIDGYTDSTGTAQYNEVLSNERAAAVRDFLIAQGVPVNNVLARGYGQSDPIASNATPQGRQQNRRVEMVVSGTAIGTAIQPTTTTSGEATSATGTTPSGNTGGISGAATLPVQPGATTTTTPGAAVGTPAGASSTTSTTTTTTTTEPSGTPPASAQPATTPQASSPTATPPNSNIPPLV